MLHELVKSVLGSIEKWLRKRNLYSEYSQQSRENAREIYLVFNKSSEKSKIGFSLIQDQIQNRKLIPLNLKRPIDLLHA